MNETANSVLLYMNACSDFVLAISYLFISGAVFYFLIKRKDILFRKTLFLFAFLFLATSVGYFIEGLGFWRPLPHFHAVIEMMAAVFALGVALLLWHYMAWALRIPNQHDMANSYKELKRVENDLWASISLLEERVAERTRELEDLSFSDPLTGVRNRRGIFRQLQFEIDYFRRHQHPLSVLMIDLDNFKNINDTHGHQAGDAVLMEAAACFTEVSRSIDTVGRVGGEEFLIVLPTTSTEEALALGARLCAAISGREIAINAPAKSIIVTCSIGAAQFAVEDDIDSIFKKADDALYKAKHQGKNCVVGTAC